MYKKIFLKTNPRYQGMIWKNDYDFSRYYPIKEVAVDSVVAPARTEKLVYSINSKDMPGFENVSMIQVIADNDYNEHEFY